MKITQQNIHKHVGDVIQLSLADAPDGTYIVLEVYEEFSTMYNLYSHEIHHLFETFSGTVITTPPAERLEMMYEGLLKHTMELMNQGWDLNPKVETDITSLVQKVKIIEVLSSKMQLKELELDELEM